MPTKPAIVRSEKLGAATGAARRRFCCGHLGVCYDVCPGAIEYEDIVAALDRLIAAGIQIPKIQLSAAMRVPAMKKDLVPAVMRYNDGVYLHQSIVRREENLVRQSRGRRTKMPYPGFAIPLIV